MLIARNSQDWCVVAAVVDYRDAPFYCPECREELIIRKGNARVHHFSHKSSSTCHYGENNGEGDAHLLAKVEIYCALYLLDGVENLHIEYPCSHTRADVYCEVGGYKLAIEIQTSELSTVELHSRTRAYANDGIYVLWLLSPTLYISNNRMVNDLRDLYGTIYVHEGNSTISDRLGVPFLLTRLEPTRTSEGYLLWNTSQHITARERLLAEDIQQRQTMEVRLEQEAKERQVEEQRLEAVRKTREDFANHVRDGSAKAILLRLRHAEVITTSRGEAIKLCWISPEKRFSWLEVTGFISESWQYDQLKSYSIFTSRTQQETSLDVMVTFLLSHFRFDYVLATLKMGTNDWSNEFNIKSYLRRSDYTSLLLNIGSQIKLPGNDVNFNAKLSTLLCDQCNKQDADRLTQLVSQIA